MKRKFTIIGGGLSGLALANGLRLADVPVEVIEAGRYPRHRVCGEFMAGLSQETIEMLGLETCFEDALSHQSSAWFKGGNRIKHYTLPAPVLGISRWALDTRMAKLLRQRGGTLTEGVRAPLMSDEGVLLTSGRLPRSSGYFGLKGHWSGLQTSADLDLHLGKQAYVGLSAVESGHVNVCGLFKSIAPGEFPSPVERLYATFTAHGLDYLVHRLRAAEYRQGSFCSVSGLSYKWTSSPGLSTMGDSNRQIPPFTGNGMTIALESARKLLPAAIDYSRGDISWRTFLAKRDTTLRKDLNRRYFTANLLHPFLLKPPLQVLLCGIARAKLIPFSTLYRLTHT